MATLSYGQLRDLWVASGGDPLQSDTAAAVALAESGGRTDAINNSAYPSRPGYHRPVAGAQPEYSVGLWQINELAHPQYSTASLLTQTGNAHAAVFVSDSGHNWNPWSTYTSGAYKSHLLGVAGPPPAPIPVGGSTSGALEPDVFHGYRDVRNSLARHLPTQLERSRQTGLVTLRMLARNHKVRR